MFVCLWRRQLYYNCLIEHHKLAIHEFLSRIFILTVVSHVCVRHQIQNSWIREKSEAAAYIFVLSVKTTSHSLAHVFHYFLQKFLCLSVVLDEIVEC